MDWLISCDQAIAVQDAVVIYRDIDEFLQTLRCNGFVSGLALDPRTGKVRSAPTYKSGQTEFFVDCGFNSKPDRTL